jgi:hypothetical protein
MKNYLSRNAKMRKSSGPPIYNWGIPAYQSRDGFRTCPWAGKCAIGCYARQAAYTWPKVVEAYEARLALSRSVDFVTTIVAEIKRRKVVKVRIHDSGDFYSGEYRDKWFEIMRECGATEFYAYTKAIPLFRHVAIPSNFKLVFSEGGKLDAWIRPDMRHSRVFETEIELEASGYANASHDDAVALGPNPKIGLVYHGYKNRTWSTNNDAAK